jgi:hypothetical protein
MHCNVYISSVFTPVFQDEQVYLLLSVDRFSDRSILLIEESVRSWEVSRDADACERERFSEKCLSGSFMAFFIDNKILFMEPERYPFLVQGGMLQ